MLHTVVKFSHVGTPRVALRDYRSREHMAGTLTPASFRTGLALATTSPNNTVSNCKCPNDLVEIDQYAIACVNGTKKQFRHTITVVSAKGR